MVPKCVPIGEQELCIHDKITFAKIDKFCKFL